MAIPFLTLVLSTAAIAVLLPFIVYPKGTIRWIKLKNYQYEVTSSLYMCTPAEKIVFNSFLFLTISLVLIATSIYLPSHIAIISRRAVYYYTGSVVDVAATAARDNSKDFLLSLAGFGANHSSRSSASSSIIARVLGKASEATANAASN